MVNFGVIKSQVSQMLGEHYLNNQHDSAQEVYREYMRTVRNSPLLMLEYIVFRNLERKDIIKEAACKYIDSNMTLFNQFTRKEIIQENQKLEAFKQNTKLSFGDKILFEHVQDLILESSKDNKLPNVSKMHDSLAFILESVTTGCAEAPQPAASDEDAENESDDLLEGFKFEHAFKVARNQCFTDLNEGEQRILTVLTEGSEGQQKELFESLKLQALKLITEGIEDPKDRADGISRIDAMQFSPALLEENLLDLYELVS
jgi:hypothetical protein